MSKVETNHIWFSKFHKAAIINARAGKPVFPCLPNSKKPATPNGFLDATTDETQINAWWAVCHDYNLAIVPGDAGWAVIDVEAKGGGALGDLQREHGALPKTYTIKTPGGGWHFYYEGQLPSKVRPFGKDMAIDTRGYSGYVLIPPSVVDGRRYEVFDNSDIAELPSWVSELMHRPVEKREASVGVNIDGPRSVDKATAHLKQLVARGDVAVQGDGANGQTYELAELLMDWGCSAETTEALMLEHWYPHCRPNNKPSFISRTVANALRYRQNSIGCDTPTSLAEDFPNALEHAPAVQPSTSKRFHRVSDILTWHDPVDLIEGILVEREQVCWFGPPKSGKSFTALDIALCIASGKDLFGKFKVKRTGPAVYLSGEGHAGIKRRMKAWAKHHGLTDAEFDALPFYYHTGVPFTLKGAQEASDYVQAIKSEIGNPVLVVVDTMARSMGGMVEDQAGDATLYMAMVEAIREGLDATMISIGHTGKDERKGIRGSNNFEASFDTCVLQTRKGSISTIETHVAKDAEPFGPFELRFTPVPLEGLEKPGFVLQLVTANAAAVTRNQVKAKDPREELSKLMREGGLVGKAGRAQHLRTPQMADWLTTKIHGPHPHGSGGFDDEWKAQRNDILKDLNNGSSRGKPPKYHGLFHKAAVPDSDANVTIWYLTD